MLKVQLRALEDGVYATLLAECSRCEYRVSVWELLERVPVLEPSELWMLAYWYLLDQGYQIDAFDSGFIVCPTCRGMIESPLDSDWLSIAMGLECASTLVQPPNTTDSSTRNSES